MNALLAPPLADGHSVDTERTRNVNLGDAGLERSQSNTLRLGHGFIGGVSRGHQGATGFGELLDRLGDDKLGSGCDGLHGGTDLGVVSGDHDASSLLGDVAPRGVDMHRLDVLAGVSRMGVVGHSRLMGVRTHVEHSTLADVELSTVSAGGGGVSG